MELIHQDKNHLIVDPVASVVVKKIFELFTEKGYSVRKIIYLKEHKIPCPYEYKMSQGLNVKYNRKISKEHVWSDCTVKRILQDVVYIVNLAQSRITTPSYGFRSSF